MVSLSLKQSVVKFSNLKGLIVINGKYIFLSVIFTETPNSWDAKAPSALPLTTALSEVLLCTQTTLLEVRQATAPV